jgi:cellulose biosynthesis protein BcsQ
MKLKASLLDRVFKKLEKYKVVAGLATLLLLMLAYLFQTELRTWVGPHEAFLKLLALVLGPAATVVGFYLGYRSKQDMVDHSSEAQRTIVTLTSDSASRLETKQDELRTQAVHVGRLMAEAAHSREEIAKANITISATQAELLEREAKVQKLQHDIRQITEGAEELWKLKPAAPFDKYREWIHDPKGARIVTIGNLKGGVGKTTLAANLGAYISQVKNLPVLFIDVDYQGSLSSMTLLSVDRGEIGSEVNGLFETDANLATLVAKEIHLAPKLPKGWIVPASYSFGQFENRLLLRWMTNSAGALDVRYRLAHLLLNPDVRRKYAAIIIDMPPRLGMGAINALVASHHFIVPTGFDRLSGEALSQFLSQMKLLKTDLGLSLDLSGIVGMMSRATALSTSENGIWEDTEVAGHSWRSDVDFRFDQTIPRKADISKAVGEDFAILQPGKEGDGVRAVFHPLLEQICARIKLDSWR